MRKEHSEDRNKFYNKLIDTPDTSFFYKLLRRNKGDAINSVSTALKTNEVIVEDVN